MFTDREIVEEMGKLKKFAIRLTGNISDADDLVQQTVLRAIEKKTYFEEGTDLYRWTSKIMYNLFVSGWRRKTKFESSQDPEPILNMQVANANQHEHMELAAVSEAMKRMPANYREILILVCVQGLQYQEVADYLEIPVGTVRSRLSRAREYLQGMMNNAADPLLVTRPDHVERRARA